MLTEANRRLAELKRTEAGFQPASVEIFSVEEVLDWNPSLQRPQTVSGVKSGNGRTSSRCRLTLTAVGNTSGEMPYTGLTGRRNCRINVLVKMKADHVFTVPGQASEPMVLAPARP